MIDGGDRDHVLRLIADADRVRLRGRDRGA
jgi:hypothetical protein